MRSAVRIAGYNPGTQPMSSCYAGHHTGYCASYSIASIRQTSFPASYLCTTLHCTTLLAALVLFFVGTAHAESPWTEPSRELARKISEMTGPGTVVVEVA